MQLFPRTLTITTRRLLLTACALALLGCGGGGGSTSSAPAPTEPGPPPPPTSIETGGFSNVISGTGIGFDLGYTEGLSNAEVEIVAPSGVAAGDYDNDGLIDLVVVRGDVGANLLYRNLGDLQFEEVARDAGIAWGHSVGENYRHGSPGLADLDGDGHLDILLTGMGSDPTRLYRNNGDGTFSDASENSGLDAITSEFTTSPAFGDYDLDGDLDLLLAHWGTPRDRADASLESEHLWRNDTAGGVFKFTPVTISSGLGPSIIAPNDPMISRDQDDYTFTPSFARINADRYPDILMVADFNHSQVYENQLDGTFANITDHAVISDGNGMGSALGDYDGDGDLDWFVSSILATSADAPAHISMIGNRLYRNDAGIFADVTDEAGVADGGWGWGSCFIDFENDGDLDIYHTNGWAQADEFGAFSNDTSRAFVSDGEGRFTEMASELGLDDPDDGRGVVCADFDNDGDVDILQLHIGSENSASLWRNDSEGNNYLGVKLNGLPPNTGALGARVVISTNGSEQMREVLLASNYLSHNAADLHFGLGDAGEVDTLTVQWPDGDETVRQDVAANQRLTIDHPRL